jgi:DNA-binding MarR family transcriptional regulator
MPARHDAYIHKILSDIETGRPVSQRSMSKDLGVAVGLVNLLIRRLVTKGYVKVTTIPPSRVRYALTPSGMTEKARISRAYFENTVRLYTETRERIRGRLDLISQDWAYPSAEDGQKRIVFYGAGEVAEIAFVSLQSTDLKLVGIVDDSVTRPFFGLPVCSLASLTPATVNGEPFGCIIVMSIRQAHVMQAKLEARGIPPHRVVTF